METFDRERMRRLARSVAFDFTHEWDSLPEDIREALDAVRVATETANLRLRELGYPVTLQTASEPVEDPVVLDPGKPCPTCGGRGECSAGVHSFDCPTCTKYE